MLPLRRDGCSPACDRPLKLTPPGAVALVSVGVSWVSRQERRGYARCRSLCWTELYQLGVLYLTLLRLCGSVGTARCNIWHLANTQMWPLWHVIIIVVVVGGAGGPSCFQLFLSRNVKMRVEIRLLVDKLLLNCFLFTKKKQCTLIAWWQHWHCCHLNLCMGAVGGGGGVGGGWGDLWPGTVNQKAKGI